MRCKRCYKWRYFDEGGVEQSPPFGRLIRIKRNRRISMGPEPETCVLCPQPRVSTKYCENHNNRAGYVRYHRLKKKLDRIRVAVERGGKTLQEIRVELGRTQAEVAHAIGVSESRICQLEAGDGRLRKHARARLFAFLRAEVERRGSVRERQPSIAA